MKSEAWQKKLKEMIPSFGVKLNDDLNRTLQIRKYINETLELNS